MIIIKNTCVNQQSQTQMFMIKHIILLIKNKFKKFKKKFASGGEKLPIRVIDTPLSPSNNQNQSYPGFLLVAAGSFFI